MRRPRMQGLPLRFPGSTVIRSSCAIGSAYATTRHRSSVVAERALSGCPRVSHLTQRVERCPARSRRNSHVRRPIGPSPVRGPPGRRPVGCTCTAGDSSPRLRALALPDTANSGTPIERTRARWTAVASTCAADVPTRRRPPSHRRPPGAWHLGCRKTATRWTTGGRHSH